MKNFLFTLALLFANQTINAQVAFFNTFGEKNNFESLQSIRPAAEKGQYWAAGTTASGDQNGYFLMKIDSAGNAIWADTFGLLTRNETLLDFDRDTASGEMWFLFLREDSLQDFHVLAKTDQNGQFLFEKYIFQSEDELGNIRVMPTGGAVTYSQESNLFQMNRLDADGNIIWEKTTFAGAPNWNPNACTITPEGSIFLVKRISAVFNEFDITLQRINPSDGATIWVDTVQITGNPTKQKYFAALTYDPNDSTLIVYHSELYWNQTQDVFTKYAQNGQLLWQKFVQSNTNVFGEPRKLLLGADTLLVLLHQGGISLRSRLTGDTIANHDFYVNGTTPWPTQLMDAVMTDSFQLTCVGQFNDPDFLDTDAQFLQIGLPSFAFLTEKRIGITGRPHDDGLVQMTSDADGNFYTLNTTDFGAPRGLDIVLRKFNNAGELLFEKVYAEAENASNLAVLTLSDGQILLIGGIQSPTTWWNDRLFLKKVSAIDGTEIWEKIHTQEVAWSPRLYALPMPDGGATVVFTRKTQLSPTESLENQPHAIRFSALGDTIWSQRYLFDATPNEAQSNQRFIRNLEKLSDGSFLALGDRTMAYGFVLRFDPLTGAKLAGFDFVPGIFNDAELESGALATNGDLILYLNPRRIYRVSPTTGATLKFEFIYFQNRASQFGRLFRMPNGKVGGFFSHIYYSDRKAGFRYAEFSETDLTFEDSKIMETDAFLHAAVLLPDCGFAAVGNINLLNSKDLFLMKTEPFCTALATETAATNEGFTVFPNPVADGQSLQITLENDYLGTLKIEVLSLDGRVFLRSEGFKTLPTFHTTIPTSGFPNSFFVRVSDEKTTVVRLILKF